MKLSIELSVDELLELADAVIYDEDDFDLCCCCEDDDDDEDDDFEAVTFYCSDSVKDFCDAVEETLKKTKK